MIATTSPGLESACDEAACKRSHRAKQLSIGQGPTAWTIDQGRFVREAIGMTEDVVRESDLGDLGIGERALVNHEDSTVGCS